MVTSRERRYAGARRVRAGAIGALLGLGLALGAMLFPAIASAHAYYVSSNPKANAVVTKAPAVITVTFAENVNPQGSDIIVYDSTHKQVSTASATVVTSNLKEMTVPMQGDGDGIYLVEWHTVSADDGASDIGGFNFVVNAAGKLDPSTGLTTSATATSPAATSSSGAPVWLVALIGVVGLVVGGGGGYFAARRAK